MLLRSAALFQLLVCFPFPRSPQAFFNGQELRQDDELLEVRAVCPLHVRVEKTEKKNKFYELTN